MKLFRAVFRWYRADWPRLVVALALAVLATGLGLLKPWPVALVVDQLRGVAGAAKSPGFFGTGRIPVLVGFLLGVSLAHAAVNAVLNLVLIDTGLRGLRRVRTAVFDWLLGLSLRRLWGNQAGDIQYRATWDIYAFQTLFQHGGFAFLTATGSLVAMTVVMWRLDPTLTWVAVATVPPLLVTMRWFGRGMSERATAAQGADGKLSSRLQQVVAHLPVLQSFTAEAAEAGRYALEADAAYAARRRQHRTELAYLAAVGGIFAVGTAGIVGFGVDAVRTGRITLGEFLVFLAYLAQFYEPLNQLSNVGGTVSQARAGATRVLELLEQPGELPLPARPVALPKATGGRSIRFEGVEFGYSPGHPALSGIDLEVGAGECIALVGPSGAGKSTLLQLVPRFLDPDSGIVRIDGVDLRGLDLIALRRDVAVMPQESPLLAGTIADNLRLGRATASRGEVEAAARWAQAHAFIERLPMGYDTVVGDGAVRLSVGERQRIGLARAFLKNAPVLLLDEPTSALDAESESLVLASLAELRRGRTTIMVVHRLRTIETADRIAVLNAGRLLEVGAPARLLRSGGWFARMRESQG